MSVTIHIPAPLREHTGGSTAVTVEGATVRAALAALGVQYPGIPDRVFDAGGAVKRFINLYLNDEDVRYLDGLDTAVNNGDELSIIPAVAGG